MKKVYLLLLGSAFVLSGCVARTYPLTQNRIDQDITTGNRGYLTGKACGEEKVRKDTRTVRVFELELGLSNKTKNKAVTIQDTQITPETNYTPESLISESALNNQNFQKYTVGKNDTLQKISQKFYGTTKKWMRIYEANKDNLKAPDRLYPGQTLNIPEEGIKTSGEALKEPEENLK